MNDPIHIEGGEVLASLDDRTVTGLLIPYGEKGRTNVGIFEVQAGAVRIPADPSVVTLNLDHDRFQPVGRATRIWEDSAVGIMASFAYASTPEGDAALADARNPKGERRSLSGEFRTGIKNGKATGGVLAAAAQCARGAFPSAMVLAADTPEVEDDEETEETTGDTVAESHTDDTYTDADGNKWTRVYDSETVETDTGTQTTTTITETYTDPAAEAATDQEESEVTASAVPATQRKGAPTITTTERERDHRDVFAALAAIKRNRHDSDALEVLAAFSDITVGGANALPTGGDVLRPNWLGKLYQGIPYEREYIDLATLGTDISLGGKAGYTIHRGTAADPLDRFDGSWAGNKAAIKSGVARTLKKASSLDRFAFGNDIGREFWDLPGGEEVIEEYIALIVEDHLRWSDELALDVIRTVAGDPIAPTEYPGVAGHDFPDALGQMIQGIMAVKRKKADGRKDVPTFVIANEAAYEELLYTPKDLVPEFVKFSASTDGEGNADGLRLVMGDTGVENTPSVIVGSGKAIDFDEIAGGPLKIDALDLPRGGVDKAVHGYLQTFIVRPEAIVHIGIEDA
ncbi:hypothetical protein [Microbacterium sp. GCS4]|uniref:hypothetical protein n=1 Tax=Microbacterium sp. GCS4 TaxID=1692239 RepID=UPI00068286EB|nr:hypothetical protein [Microbacterium sp. GCS4]KNY07921.1 hypothetical protein AKH00_06805 [Microbacterium sp. GCS4]